MNLKEKIFEKIKDGTFLSTSCNQCKKHIWPPSNNCKECFQITELKDVDNKGILLEISYSHIVDQKGYFGIGDFSGLRIIGKVNSNIEIGEPISISKVTANKDNKIIVEFDKL
ncbi:MAG: hypothetical protein H0U27_08585 [Nitrosopumilus sp.]|nr:hypothetical protein [Nitrosopumilus sp.]